MPCILGLKSACLSSCLFLPSHLQRCRDIHTEIACCPLMCCVSQHPRSTFHAPRTQHSAPVFHPIPACVISHPWDAGMSWWQHMGSYLQLWQVPGGIKSRWGMLIVILVVRGDACILSTHPNMSLLPQPVRSLHVASCAGISKVGRDLKIHPVPMPLLDWITIH